jgi:hypothetical protein
LKKRPKCELIPVHEYDGIPPIAYEDKIHRYVKGPKGHYTKLTRKTCSECGSGVLYVGIFTYRKHKRVERFCVQHAKHFANNKELPAIPEIESKPRESIII